MSQWGREAAGAAAIAGAPTAYLAKRSILCAVIAYIIAVAAFVVAFRMPGDIPPPWPTLVPLTVGILFAIVVPIIHIVGVVYGARALSRPAESRALAGLGIGLNLLSIAGVVFAVWALMAPQAG
jgi:hypothetical protein